MSRFRAFVPLAGLAVVGVVYLAALYMRSTGTELQLEEAVKVVGTATPVRLVAINPHGVRSVRGSLSQGGHSYAVYEKAIPARRWNLFPKAVNPTPIEFEAGTGKANGLKDGKATLRIEAVSNDFAGQTDTLELEVEVNSRPPAVSVDEGQHYLNLGGSEVVVFTASGYWSEAGVRVGKYTFRSFALPGAKDGNRRVCFFAIPYDMPRGEVPVVYVRNPAGAEATSRFWNKLTWKTFRRRNIEVTDAFLEKIFKELDPGGKGNAAARFVKINSDMRKANAQALSELRLKTADKILWHGPFLQLANSSVEAQFCDYRDYFYQRQMVDQQVHLGFDLAVTAHTPVAAANDGVVVFGGPLGIYGNAIVTDHGLGLQSLYAHLSEIQVKPGDAVKKGQIIGKSGATGLAGGDHLHFSMMVDGVMVNPVEWWDGHWIHDRVLAPLKMGE
ncbi:MAG: M23 family metallopeptidase [Bryobacterales bacterium]|nr:M23 family metallopeptidase [Bryobacterales bacterium]